MHDAGWFWISTFPDNILYKMTLFVVANYITNITFIIQNLCSEYLKCFSFPYFVYLIYFLKNSQVLSSYLGWSKVFPPVRGDRRPKNWCFFGKLSKIYRFETNKICNVIFWIGNDPPPQESEKTKTFRTARFFTQKLSG